MVCVLSYICTRICLETKTHLDEPRQTVIQIPTIAKVVSSRNPEFITIQAYIYIHMYNYPAIS